MAKLDLKYEIKKNLAFNWTSKKFQAFVVATILRCFDKISPTIWLYCFYAYVGINVLQKGIEVAPKVIDKIKNGGGKENHG